MTFVKPTYVNLNEELAILESENLESDESNIEEDLEDPSMDKSSL